MSGATTTSNSSPFAACTVITRILSGGWVGDSLLGHEVDKTRRLQRLVRVEAIGQFDKLTHSHPIAHGAAALNRRPPGIKSRPVTIAHQHSPHLGGKRGRLCVVRIIDQSEQFAQQRVCDMKAARRIARMLGQ